MKTTTIDVGGLLSPLCARGVEKQLCRMPGVKRADANFVSGSATVEYDESVTDLERIKRCIRDCLLLRRHERARAGGGRTVVHVARAGELWGLIAIADAPRPTSAATVAALRQRGVDVAMLTATIVPPPSGSARSSGYRSCSPRYCPDRRLSR
jgi:cation transport ATPase